MILHMDSGWMDVGGKWEIKKKVSQTNRLIFCAQWCSYCHAKNAKGILLQNSKKDRHKTASSLLSLSPSSSSSYTYIHMCHTHNYICISQQQQRIQRRPQWQLQLIHDISDVLMKFSRNTQNEQTFYLNVFFMRYF